MSVPVTEPTWLDLADWRQRVLQSMVSAMRRNSPPIEPPVVLQRFRDARDELFRSHPQSPLDTQARQQFAGLYYFPFAAEFRVTAETHSAAGCQSMSTMPSLRPRSLSPRRGGDVYP